MPAIKSVDSTQWSVPKTDSAKSLPPSKPDYMVRSSTPFSPHHPTSPTAWDRKSAIENANPSKYDRD